MDFIGGAQRTLDIAVQELDNEAIAQAILNARFRGVSVRMVVEQDYLLTGEAAGVGRGPGGRGGRPAPASSGAPRPARTAWRRTAGSSPRCCGATWTSSPTTTPRSSTRSSSSVTTAATPGRPRPCCPGSANFTVTDCHQNLNHVVIFHDVAVCKEYAGEFASIRAGHFGRGEHGAVPKCHNINGVPVKVLFAPDHTPELEIMKQMLKATDRVDFAIFTFSGSSGIDDTMVALQRRRPARARRGRPGQGVQKWAATHDLDRAGIEIFFPRPRRRRSASCTTSSWSSTRRSWWPARSTTPPPRTSTTTRTSSCSAARSWTCRRPRAGRSTRPACAEIARYFRAEIDRIVAGGTRFVGAPGLSRKPTENRLRRHQKTGGQRPRWATDKGLAFPDGDRGRGRLGRHADHPGRHPRGRRPHRRGRGPHSARERAGVAGAAAQAGEPAADRGVQAARGGARAGLPAGRGEGDGRGHRTRPATTARRSPTRPRRLGMPCVVVMPDVAPAGQGRGGPVARAPRCSWSRRPSGCRVPGSWPRRGA